MSNQDYTTDMSNRHERAAGRRRELRALLLSAADTARQGRRIPEFASRIAHPVGRAIRDRLSMLFSAAE